MLPIYFYFLLFSCTIGNQNNTQKGTKKEKALYHLEKIAILSTKVEEAAFDLESAIDESRRALQNGSNPTTENKKRTCFQKTQEHRTNKHNAAPKTVRSDMLTSPRLRQPCSAPAGGNKQQQKTLMLR